MLGVEGVSKAFGALAAVQDVSFSVSAGEVLGIMGPNGAGKTTLLNLIMGVFPVDKGEIRFEGERISGLPTSEISRRGIGRTYQIPQPFRRMTVIENLMVGELYAGQQRAMRVARSNAMGVLERVGLASMADAVAGKLGLVDLKRLELARALSLQPRLLLLDEIAAGLVESEISDLAKLLQDLKQAGQTMIVIEHVLRVMFEHCDRLLVLDFGECVTTGTPGEVARDQRVIDIYLGTEEGRTQVALASGASFSPPDGRPELLSLFEVSAAYGEFQALFDVSLEVREGEILALIGQNGAGKTTLIRAITRQMPIISGDIKLRGQSLLQIAAHDMVELGVAQCFEGRKIFPHMTVRENLEVGAYANHARAKRQQTIQRIFELFPILAERTDQLGGTLSGGEQQMLAIGRALMALPDLIIFDEISLGLAPLVIDHLYEAVLEINRQGTTVLLVEQNVHRSLSIAHRAHILERGRIVLSGTAEQLSRNQSVKEAYFGL